MPTAHQIAQRTGVSAATVSRVLNNRPGISAATRKIVMTAAAEAGVRSREHAASALRVALIYAMSDPVAPFFGYDADLAAGLFRTLGDHGGQLVVLNLSERQSGESYHDFFFRMHIDAAVLRVNDATRHVAVEMAEEDLPCVVASDRYAEPNVGFVGYESRTGMGDAIDYLVNLGHREIAYVQPMPGINHDFNERLDAFTEGMTRHGLDGASSMIVNAELSRRGGASAMDQLMSRRDPPSAVIFATPVATVGGVRRAMQLRVRIPEELSVVGFDDGQLRRMVFPSFSAICQESRLIGHEAGRILLEHLRARRFSSVIEQRVLPSVFEVNETTAPPRVERSAPV
ncbi:MAG: LacI family DNA-binding transcriptional regulator [Planctomycetota bacterium]